ncbi:MAG TPA: Vms1/Ankzf1 family peptidyl-tRNA hydrolase [Gaiellaceae bacterium]|nr:Vms1/Ankzf1 family peptidyl-tRNA hydrolase [Gaiellaceae bacterium]
MAANVTWEQLRDLAGFRAEKGCALSIYVDLDPSEAPTPPDVETKVNSLLASAERQLEERKGSMPRDRREGLKQDLQRVADWFADGFDRSGVRGLALFADGLDNFWATLALPDRVPDDVRIGAELYLAPLARLAGRDGGLVAFVGRERGQVWRLRGGELRELADQSAEIHSQHSQGGWSQARYERSIENEVGQHLRDVAATLDTCVRKLRGTRVVLIGAEDIRSEFESLLTNEVRSCVAGWAGAEAHADRTALLEAAKPVLDEWWSGREEELLERWREEAGKNGRAASGWESTLEAASDGRVDLLLVQEGADRAAYQCPQCGRASLADGSCPLDGTTMESRDDGLDLALHQTLAHGGTVHVVRDRRDLEPVGGLGALLRF